MPALGKQRVAGVLAVFVGALGLGALAWPNINSTTTPILAGTERQHDVPAGAQVTLDGRRLSVQEQRDPAAPDVLLRRYVVIPAPRLSLGRPLDLAIDVPASDDAQPPASNDAALPTPLPSASPNPTPPSNPAEPAPASATRARDVRHEFFRVVSRSAAFGAFGLALLILIGLPYALGGAGTNGVQQKHGVFYALLVENDKLSLGRFQFLLWFMPAFGMYAALSVPLAEFAPMTSTLALLLGLSGITAGLSASAPTGARSGAPEAPAARMSQAVENDQGQTEVSRYQYLVLSLLGSILLTVAFLRTLSVPAIPTEFLFLVGASQGTFLFNKVAQQRP